jgi:hypothetical protein
MTDIKYKTKIKVIQGAKEAKKGRGNNKDFHKGSQISFLNSSHCTRAADFESIFAIQNWRGDKEDRSQRKTRESAQFAGPASLMPLHSKFSAIA